jgi:hypothetical protein
MSDAATPPTLAEPLGQAFDRLHDFLAVWPDGIPPDAVERLQESVGLEPGARRLFAERLEALEPAASPGAALLGLLIGLSAGRPASER